MATRNLVDESSEPKSDYDKWFQDYYQGYKKRRTEELTGAVRSVAGGLTFQLADEIEALIRAGSKEEGNYEDELKIIREQQDRYELLNPGKAFALEAGGAVATGYGLSRGLTALGVTSQPIQFGIEAGAYGAGSGDTFEERVQLSTIGAASGLALGKLIQMATTPSSAGGLRTKADELADESEVIDDKGQMRAIQKAEEEEIYTEVDNPQYTRKPLRDAQTAGELFDGMIGAVKNFYDDKLTGVSDRLIRRVSAQVGARYQRADETALRVINKELDGLSKELVPVIKVINESTRAKGVLLDFAAGKLGKSFDDSIVRLEKELSEELNTEHMALLKRYIGYSSRKNRELNTKVFGADFTRQKQTDFSGKYTSRLLSIIGAKPQTSTLVDEVFNASQLTNRFELFDDLGIDVNNIKQLNDFNQSIKELESLGALRESGGLIAFRGLADATEPTYLHTRNRGYRDRLKEKGMTDAEIEKMFEDPAFEQRTRGSYLDEADPRRPDPSEYENPILSDMRRIFKMQRLAEIQRKFGVRIDDYKQGPRKDEALMRSSVPVFLGQRTGEMATDPILLTRNYQKAATDPLTPDEFMDAFELTLRNKGISDEGAAFARKEITEAIMGQAKTPHPLIQAANSLAYAVTLAGPMSAILNLADIPMLGAKYGGGAVREGLKVVSPFKKPPNADLEKMGLNNQTFGEFVNLINDQIDNQQGFMARTAELMRKGTDFMMRGSGFAAMDRVGKRGVMRGVLKNATDNAKAGKLADNWGFYFNKTELDILSDQLQKHGMDWQNYTGRGSELIEELMFAGLGQQQLISAAGRPAAWARHPNLRPLWALRGFVIKQQALALREVMGNIKAGKPEEAAKFLGRYAVYGAGGYAVINEGRQFIFGDGEASFGGLARGYGDAVASLLTANTLGMNDYQFGQMKTIGILPTFALGLEPIATSRARDLISTGIEVLDKERPPQALLTEIPFFKQSLRAGRNISELLDEPEAQSMFEEALRQRND